jgi:hypothetical protein
MLSFLFVLFLISNSEAKLDVRPNAPLDTKQDTKQDTKIETKSPQFQKAWSLPADFKIDQLRVGGLSGCALKDDRIYFASDDRGAEGGARIVSFGWELNQKEVQFKSGKNLIIEKKDSKKILDIEGLAFNDKNEILVSNEGDQNKKPRQAPELFWINQRGQRLSSIELPDEFVPNLSGQQVKGIQNNLGFEGLSIDLNFQKWGAFLEGPLLKGPSKSADHLLYIESDLSQLRSQRKFSYPLPQFEGSSLTMAMGVTDFLYLSADQLLVLERGVEFSMQGIVFNTQLCFADKDKGNLLRKCPYVFNTDTALLKSIHKTANFEGLCWLNEKKTQFLVVSDNNFSNSENTVFLLYELN